MNIEKNIKNIATRALLNEAKAVENLANYIDGGFEACVEVTGLHVYAGEAIGSLFTVKWMT